RAPEIAVAQIRRERAAHGSHARPRRRDRPARPDPPHRARLRAPPAGGKPGARGPRSHQLHSWAVSPITISRKGACPVDPSALEDIPLFAALTDEERAEVAASLRDVTVDTGEMLTVQGDNAWHLFVIRSGEAEVRRDGEVVRTLGPGDVLGEIGLLATGTRT